MSGVSEEISPRYLGEDRIRLSLAQNSTNPRAHDVVEVDVDYSAVGESGVAVPLELTITGPSAASFQRRYFRRVAPSSVSFVPIEGGTHLLRIREVGHNRWVGLLTIDVAGTVLSE